MADSVAPKSPTAVNRKSWILDRSSIRAAVLAANNRCAQWRCTPSRQLSMFAVVCQVIAVTSVVRIAIMSRPDDRRRTDETLPSAVDITNSSHPVEIRRIEPDTEEKVLKNTSSTTEKVKISLTIGAVAMAQPTTNACVERFLKDYEKICQTRLPQPAQQIAAVNKSPVGDGFLGNLSAELNSSAKQQQLELCACVPRHLLIGRINPLSPKLRPPVVLPNITEVQTVQDGGIWAPSDCVARQRLAIIIPYRDRREHLHKLLKILHPFLQRQLAEYAIFVVEQDKASSLFNKASLMNAGYREIRSLSSGQSTSVSGLANSSDYSRRPFDCYIFHDVDMLPEDDRNFYGCEDRAARHVAVYINKFGYRLFYHDIFGGATAFRPEVFELVNGFSNEFYGWGGEDDDMNRRIRSRGLNIVRYPSCVATYSAIMHVRDGGNPVNRKRKAALKFRPKRYGKDGVNTVSYKLIAIEATPLYTRIYISIPPSQQIQRQKHGGKKGKCRGRRKGRKCD